MFGHFTTLYMKGLTVSNTKSSVQLIFLSSRSILKKHYCINRVSSTMNYCCNNCDNNLPDVSSDQVNETSQLNLRFLHIKYFKLKSYIIGIFCLTAVAFHKKVLS